MAAQLTILGPQTLPSAAGVRRAQPPFGPIHIRPWHSSSLPDLVPIDKYTHTYELKTKFYHGLNFKFSMYHFRLLFISTYKKLADFFTYALFPGEQPERFFSFVVTEEYPTMLSTLQGFQCSTGACYGWMPFLTPPLAFSGFEPWTSWQAQRPYPLGHSCSLVYFNLYLH